MPIRREVDGSVQQPELAGYSGGQVASARFREATLGTGSGSAFWQGLLKGVQNQLPAIQQQTEARGYLLGQQDSADGKQRRDVHIFMETAYTQGYNRAEVGAQLAQFQTDLQTKAVEFVNSGKSSDEFRAYAQQQTSAILKEAGAQGMDLRSQDWQAWLQGVEATNNTAGDLFQTKSLERAAYLKSQALAAEGNAAVATFAAADQAGNPLQALENIQTHIQRIYADQSMTPQDKDGALANFIVNSGAVVTSSSAVDALGAYYQELPEFKNLPTQVQTQVISAMQARYDERARDEVTATFEYMSTVRSIQDPTELEAQYPMQSVIARLNEDMKSRKITPAQMYSMVNEENVRRAKLQKAASTSTALMEGTTMSDIATTTGMTLGKVRNGLIETAAAAGNGYSGGGLMLVQRGLNSGAADITTVGIEMLQQDAQSLGSIDPRNLKTGPDGEPLYPSTVVNSLTNIKQAYDSAIKAGNQVQANQLLAGLPDAVAYGVRQANDANSVANVVYRRAGDLAAGRVVAMPQKMPTEILATNDDVTAGLFDTNLTQKGQARNLLGVKAYIFSSDEDKAAQEVRLNQVNAALSEEYTALQQQGLLPARTGDDLKTALIGRVAARTVRIDDGTDNGTLLILPQVADKEAILGSVDNNIIGQGLMEFVQDYKERHPGAVSVQLRYDNMTDELVVSGVDSQNVLLTTDDGIPVARVRDSVRAVETRLTNNGNGNAVGALAVPTVGFVQFDANNQYGIDQTVFKGAVNQLISYEGYTDTKGFSILATHPTTGEPLNEEKYVKQPTDTPQMAADKLRLYLDDKVLPPVMRELPKYDALPEYLKEAVFKQLVETTYHAGNPQAFSSIMQDVLAGNTLKAYEDFRNSALYKDAGPDSRRNKDRLALLQALSQYRVFNQ